MLNAKNIVSIILIACFMLLNVSSLQVNAQEDESWRTISGQYYDWTVTKEPERPYIHDYSQTLTMKLFMSKVVDNQAQVSYTFEEALELIKKVDIVTEGLPKIIYLVGWQYNGHDDKYPSWDVVNENLKRPQDETAVDSLKWLMDEAFKYNTTISLHINMTDAYEDSPLWNTYVENDLIAKNLDGSLYSIGTYNGKKAYKVLYKNEWEKGFAVQRIDRLLAMLPIERAGTIHLDAFFSWKDDLYHNVSQQEEEEYMRRIFRYWRDKGVDVTCETYKKNRIDPFIGLQPMAWANDFGQDVYLGSPATLAVGGTVYSDEDLGFLFGQSMHGEGSFIAKSSWEDTFIKEFCLQTLPWYYQNRYDRLSLTGSGSSRVAHYSDGLEVRLSDKSMIHNGRTLRMGDDVFIPALWKGHKEIIAYSKNGYKNKLWQLPDDWAGINKVDTYYISGSGMIVKEKDKDVSNMSIDLSISQGRGVIIVPAETPVENVITKDMLSTIKIIKRDDRQITDVKITAEYKIDGKDHYDDEWVGDFNETINCTLDGAAGSWNILKQQFLGNFLTIQDRESGSQEIVISKLDYRNITDLKLSIQFKIDGKDHFDDEWVYDFNSDKTLILDGRNGNWDFFKQRYVGNFLTTE